MTHGVGGDWLGDVCSEGGFADGALDDGFVQMMSAHLTCGRVGVGAGGGEDPLPIPFARGAGVLARQGLGQDNGART